MRALHVSLAFGVGLAAGSILVGPLGAQTQKQLRQARKLLEKIVLVDGAGSGLDADTVQGLGPEDFLGADAQAVDAARLDGINASEIRATGIHVETLQGSEVALTSEECTNIISCTVANPSNFSRNVLVRGLVNVRLGHTQGSDDLVEVTLATGGATCVSPSAGGTASAWFHVDQGIGTSCCFRGTLNPVKTFPIAANSAVTFYLNGTLASDSGAATRQVDSGNLQCTLVR